MREGRKERKHSEERKEAYQMLTVPTAICLAYAGGQCRQSHHADGVSASLRLRAFKKKKKNMGVFVLQTGQVRRTRELKPQRTLNEKFKFVDKEPLEGVFTQLHRGNSLTHALWKHAYRGALRWLSWLLTVSAHSHCAPGTASRMDDLRLNSFLRDSFWKDPTKTRR